jgi:hypothetical protein
VALQVVGTLGLLRAKPTEGAIVAVNIPARGERPVEPPALRNGDRIARHLQQHEQLIGIGLKPLVTAQEREAWRKAGSVAWLALPALLIIVRLEVNEKPGIPIGSPSDVMARHAAQLVVEQFAQLACFSS